MARKVRMFVMTAPCEIELLDGEVARVVDVQSTRTTLYQQQYNPATTLGSLAAGGYTSVPSGEAVNWVVLVIVGPPETVDEMAKAMERTLRSAP